MFALDLNPDLIDSKVASSFLFINIFFSKYCKDHKNYNKLEEFKSDKDNG